jgi:hypothetical protein
VIPRVSKHKWEGQILAPLLHLIKQIYFIRTTSNWVKHSLQEIIAGNFPGHATNGAHGNLPEASLGTGSLRACCAAGHRFSF